MIIVFWIFAVFWAGIVFLQLMMKGLAEYAGAYTLGYWGMRYTEEIIWIEVLLLIVVGFIVHKGPKQHHKRAMATCALGCFILLGLQAATFRKETGYIYRKMFAGDYYQIPWRYGPSANSGYAEIRIVVAYPGFTPLHAGRTPNQTKVIVEKSPESSREKQNPLFKTPRRVDVPECTPSGNSFSCRFFHAGFWYEYRYDTNLGGKTIQVPLDEAMSKLPKLYNSFIEGKN